MRLMDVNWKGVKGKPGLDYALLDFGAVSKNSRYVKDNPFGNNTPVVCFVEINHESLGQWFNPGHFISLNGSEIGTNAGMVLGSGIVVATGENYLCERDHFCGALSTGTVVMSSAYCRVHVWRVHQ